MRRLRSVLLLAAISLPVLAGCFAARSRTPATTPPPTTPATPPVVVPPVISDSTKPVVVRTDSARAADSLALVRRADSLAKALLTDTSAGAKVAAAAAKPKKAPVAKPCVLDFSDSPPETRLTYTRIDSANATTYIGGGFIGHCQGEKNRISADSAEQFQLAGVLNLFGNVTYEEPGKMRFNAAHATYFTREERLYADGMVTATQLSTGSTFSGPSIEYFRPMAGVRTTSKLIAPNNPTANLIEKDSTGRPGTPVRINAAMMIDVADSLLYAIGSVVITRGALIGRSDSATFDKGSELARLIRNANVVNADSGRKFTLTGDTIDLYSADRTLNRVLALHNATAVNNDVTIQAERIDLRLKEQKLSQAFAYGGGRSRARTPQQEVVADSLDIVMPEQRVSEMRAVGNAIATGTPDTLKIRSDDRDQLRGDTVIARFDSAKFAGDTSQPRVREIQALGNASSLFQIASRQGPTFPPALNYSRGKTILVQFDSGLVRDVTIDSSASGVYLEPAVDSLLDTTSRRPPRRPPAETRQSSVREATMKSAPKALQRPRPNPLPATPASAEIAVAGAASTVPRRRS